MRTLALAILAIGLTVLAACEQDVGEAQPAIPDAFADRLALLDMLGRGAFDQLDARLSGLQDAFEAGRVSEASVNAAFRTFMNSEPRIRDRLDEWVAAIPRSYAAWLASGFSHWQRGWHARGHRLAAQTAPERFAAMAEAFAQARRDLTAAIEINPKLTPAHALLINMAMTQARRSELNAATAAGLQAVPHSFVIREAFLAARRPWWGWTLPEIDAFTSLTMDEFPDLADLRALAGYPFSVRAHLLYRTGKYSDSVRLFDLAINRGDYWKYYYWRGQAHQYGGNDADARADYDRALALWPQEPKLLNDRGWLHYGAERFDEALADLGLALEFAPLDPAIRVNRAIVLEHLERYEEAIEDLDTAAIYGGDDAKVLLARGRILFERRDDAETARADLQRTVQISPDNADGWLYLGRVLHQLGDCDARDAVETHLRLCRASPACGDKLAEESERRLQSLTEQNSCPR